jgi:DNA integrity scanning protein DisA with diadenylate cyclase activity
MNMDMHIFMTGLLAVSILTTLTTQAIKTLLKEYNKKLPSNTLASIVSVVIAVALSIGYAILNNIQCTASYVVCVVALAYLGFLCATNGYDKVKQAISQFITKKGE